MTTITGYFESIARAGTTGRIVIMSREPRSTGGSVVTTERQSYPVVDGAFTTDELVAGPARVELEAPGVFQGWNVTIPDDAQGWDFHDLVDLDVDYSPPVVGQAQQAVREARAEADRSRGHAEDADVSRRAAADLRDETEDLRDEAQGLVDLIPDLELTLDYADLQNIPEVFTPAAHTHLSADITDAQCCSVENVIIRRDDTGRFTVVEPIEDAHPVSKGWAVAQIAAAMDAATGMTPEQIQMLQDLADQLSAGEDALGLVMQQLELKLDKASAVYSRDAGAAVPRRNEAGQIAVPSVPNVDEHATSRAYVDTMVGDADTANRNWTMAQIDALTQIVDDQAGQIAALQQTVATLRDDHDVLEEVAVQSLTVNRIEQVTEAPSTEDALEDEIYFVRRDDAV